LAAFVGQPVMPTAQSFGGEFRNWKCTEGRTDMKVRCRLGARKSFAAFRVILEIVLAKSIGLSWDTMKAILKLRSGTKSDSANGVELWREKFAKLKEEVAVKAIKYYRLRERAAGISIKQ
jgi:hypothetical protein